MRDSLWGDLMIKYKVTAEVDEEWFMILGQITRHQEGFLWLKVKEIKEVNA
jgi:hypothetical protein